MLSFIKGLEMLTKSSERCISLLVYFLFIVSASAAELRVAVTEYSPHVNVENGQVKGPALQYLRSIFETSFEKVTFVTMPNKRALLELNKGTIDILFPLEQQNKGITVFGEPILNVVPGICFKKDTYIPILSAPGALDYLDIGVPPTLPLVPIFSRSFVNIKVIEGSNVLNRGIQLLLRGRIDGFYHPSPINVYHYNNPLSKKIACSLFYGYSEPIYLALSNKLSNKERKKLQALYKKNMSEKSYEHFLLDLRLNL